MRRRTTKLATGKAGDLQDESFEAVYLFIGMSRVAFLLGRSLYRTTARLCQPESRGWGGDFTSAWIQSQYASPIVPNYPYACGIQKYDSDYDTNDDYVDEYEVGVFASPSSSVRSYCEAQWKGRFYEGTVSKGECVIYT